MEGIDNTSSPVRCVLSLSVGSQSITPYCYYIFYKPHGWIPARAPYLSGRECLARSHKHGLPVWLARLNESEYMFVGLCPILFDEVISLELFIGKSTAVRQ